MDPMLLLPVVGGLLAAVVLVLGLQGPKGGGAEPDQHDAGS